MRLRLSFLSLSKTLSISVQNSICFSFSPPSSSKKWMEGFSTSREPVGRRRPSDSRGSVSGRKSSPSWSGVPANSFTVDHKDISQSNVFESRSSRELSIGSSNVGSPQSNPENHPFDVCRTESKGPVKFIESRTSRELSMGSSNVGSLQGAPENCPFDICRTESKGPVKLNKPLFDQNREKRKEHEQTKHLLQMECLIPGMVLLRNFIGHGDQVKIVEKCRQLGNGEGGFYRPGYRDGAKLNLQMMCLGKNWDPESRQYGDIRPDDGSTPPKIPEEFRELVDKAIQASHEFLRQNSKPGNIEVELPSMSPDICIVNFYSKNGRLGLHQDRDESKKSIVEGLPVVSFSLGDDADFLYGNNRDVDSAKKVVLKSGDVLLFGGKSRLLFHGVSAIRENTAPSFLIDKAKLKPGRLNLTFRQY